MQSNPQPFASCIQDYDILGTGRNSSPPRPGSLTRGANGLGTGDEPDDLVRSLKKKKKKAPGGTYISEQAPNWVLHFRIVTLTVQIIIA
jgi:hypothetical protein